MSQGEIEESKKSIEDIESEISDFLGSLVHKASNKIAQGISKSRTRAPSLSNDDFKSPEPSRRLKKKRGPRSNQITDLEP